MTLTSSPRNSIWWFSITSPAIRTGTQGGYGVIFSPIIRPAAKFLLIFSLCDWYAIFGESSILGIYPCGEGAGYAGGITSSAMDGIKVFESIASKYKMY